MTFVTTCTDAYRSTKLGGAEIAGNALFCYCIEIHLQG